MPLTLNVGLSKKIGTPGYGSLGASCHVEVEVDSSLLYDLDEFQQKVRQIYGGCHQAIQDELQRQQKLTPNGCNVVPAAIGDVKPTGSGYNNGRPPDQPRCATASQVRAIEAIARRQEVDLANLLRNRYGVDGPANLSITQASGLIDDLKAGANGSGGGR